MIKYSKLTNYQIKKTIQHFSIDIDATKTALLLGLNRHTINRYYLIFRKAIYLHQSLELNKILGDVEFDESYFGARRKRGFHGKLKRGRGTLKQPVFGIFKRDNILGRESIYTEIVPDCKKETLQAIIKGKIDISSTITTDGWRGYDGLVDVGYEGKWGLDLFQSKASPRRQTLQSQSLQESIRTQRRGWSNCNSQWNRIILVIYQKKTKQVQWLFS